MDLTWNNRQWLICPKTKPKYILADYSEFERNENLNFEYLDKSFDMKKKTRKKITQKQKTKVLQLIESNDMSNRLGFFLSLEVR